MSILSTDTHGARRRSSRAVPALAVAGLCVVLVLATGASRADAALGTFGQPGYLGNAESFAVIAGTAITNASGGTAAETVISGDVAITPASAASITGFPPGNVIDGAIFAPNLPIGTTTAADAKADELAAFIDIDLIPPTFPAPGIGFVELGGTSPLPGVYSADDFLVNNAVTLNGDWDDVWVFQANTLTTGVDSAIILTGDANPCNVFWHLDSAATIEVGSDFVGTVLAGTSIAAKNAATINGRLFAGAAVTLDQNQITTPLCLTGPSTPGTGGGGTGGGVGGVVITPGVGNSTLANTGVEVTRPALVALLVAVLGVVMLSGSALSRRRRVTQY